MTLHTSGAKTPRPKPDRITGVAHFFAATGYSIGGVRRLWQETAFRHITLALPLCGIVLWLAGASFALYYN